MQDYTEIIIASLQYYLEGKKKLVSLLMSDIILTIFVDSSRCYVHKSSLL